MKNNILKEILITFSICLISCATLIFSYLYFDTFYAGFIFDKIILLKIITLVFIIGITITTVVFFGSNKQFIYKLFYILLCLLLLFSFVLFLLKKLNFFDKFDSVESFRLYIASFGNIAFLLFILIQFLQVCVLPISAFITVGAGVLLFGPFWGGVYSAIGIISGSIVAYFVGRIFGYKVAKWLVGKKNLDKWLKIIKGKDKIILTFMFLFPFFPDDILCFVSGITTIEPLFFIIMIFITRIISIFTSTYSMNNSLIPYNTWWGILLWACVFIVIVILSYFIIKHSDKLEKLFKRRNR